MNPSWFTTSIPSPMLAKTISHFVFSSPILALASLSSSSICWRLSTMRLKEIASFPASSFEAISILTQAAPLLILSAASVTFLIGSAIDLALTWAMPITKSAMSRPMATENLLRLYTGSSTSSLSCSITRIHFQSASICNKAEAPKTSFFCISTQALLITLE